MDRDHHGYEIRTQLRDRLGVWANVSFGSIYPALARLERQGCVEAVTSSETRLSSLSTVRSLVSARHCVHFARRRDSDAAAEGLSHHRARSS